MKRGTHPHPVSGTDPCIRSERTETENGYVLLSSLRLCGSVVRNPDQAI